MLDQSNISKYYPEAKLQELRTLLASRNSSFDKATISNFSQAAHESNIHKNLTPQFESFLNFLGQFIQLGQEKLESKVIEEEISNHFESKPSPENTMWQIRFLNYIFDNQMRQKLHTLETPEQKIKFAGVKQRVSYDSQGNEWNIATHQSLGKGSRAFEQPFHIYNDFPNSVIAIESIDENYLSLEHKASIERIKNLVHAKFNSASLQRVPNIQIKQDFIESLSKDDAIQFVNKKPVSEFLSELISKDTQDGRSLIELTKEKLTVEKMLINGDENSSLVDFYLYRMNAFRDGNKIVPFHDSDGNKLDYEFGFDPKNYQGKEGQSRLSIEAFNFFKDEMINRPATFLDYIFDSKYHFDINLRTSFKGFKAELWELRDDEKKESYNLSAIINLGDDILSLNIGDSILIPIYHKDLSSTYGGIEELKDTQILGKDQIKRIELGTQSKTTIKSKFPEYVSNVVDKDEIEAFIFASRTLINNRRLIKNQKKKKPYREFFNSIIAPYISDTTSLQRDKDKKLLADTLSFTSADNALGLLLLSHKINDDNDRESETPLPDFDFDVNPATDDPSIPWIDPPVDANTPFELA